MTEIEILYGKSLIKCMTHHKAGFLLRTKLRLVSYFYRLLWKIEKRSIHKSRR